MAMVVGYHGCEKEFAAGVRAGRVTLAEWRLSQRTDHETAADKQEENRLSKGGMAMLDFTCPACGKCVQADDAFAGAPMLCVGCNVAMSSPQLAAIATPTHADQAKVATGPTWSAGAFHEGEPPPAEPLPSPRKDAPRIVSRWLAYSIAGVIILTLGLFLINALQKIRETAARAESIKNLKQIGLAFHAFHDHHKRLPFNGTGSARPGDETSGSWAFQILPFIEQRVLFNQPDTIIGVPEYMCPGRDRPMVSSTGAWTDYFINSWINDPLNGTVNLMDGKRSLLGITDGSSNTIFVGHGSIDPRLYSSRVAFAQSTDIFKGGDHATARRSTTNQPDTAGDAALNWGGPFAQGCLFCMGDATVRVFPYATYSGGAIKAGVASPWAPGTASGLGAFLTPSGGIAENGSPPGQCH